MIEQNVSEKSGQEQILERLRKFRQAKLEAVQGIGGFQHNDWPEPRNGGGTEHWKAFSYM